MIEKVRDYLKPYAVEKEGVIEVSVWKGTPGYKNLISVLSTLSFLEREADAEREVYDLIDEITLTWDRKEEKAYIRIGVNKAGFTYCISTVQFQALAMDVIVCPKCKAEITPGELMPVKQPGSSVDEYVCPRCGERFEDFYELEYFTGHMLV